MLVIKGFSFLLGVLALILIVFMFHIEWNPTEPVGPQMFVTLVMAMVASFLCVWRCDKGGGGLQIGTLFTGTLFLFLMLLTPRVSFFKFYSIGGIIFFITSIILGSIGTNAK